VLLDGPQVDERGVAGQGNWGALQFYGKTPDAPVPAILPANAGSHVHSSGPSLLAGIGAAGLALLVWLMISGPSDRRLTAVRTALNGNGRGDWLQILGWVSIALVVAMAALLVLFLGVIGIRPADAAQGASYTELLMAARAPVAYRVFTTLDGLGWLLIGAELMLLAGLSWEAAPRRSVLAAATGVTQVIGSVGGFTRMVGVGDIASSWSASGADHAQLLAAYDSVARIIHSDFLAGDVLQGIGFLAAGSAALAASRFPRWISYFILVPGVTSSILAWSQVIGLGFLFPVLLLHIVLSIGLNISFIYAFRRSFFPGLIVPQRAMGEHVVP
jgi:hypothetical protein